MLLIGTMDSIIIIIIIIIQIVKLGQLLKHRI
jgi:hypothetical protein